MPKLFLSTVGTSIFTNVATQEERRILYNDSNCRSEKECSNIKLIEKLEQKAKEKLASENNPANLRRFSAELNGIYGFYDEMENISEDIHYLITTDTVQGKRSGNLLKKFLEEKDFNVQVYTPHELTTRTKYNFEQGIKQLLKWCDETLVNYHSAGYEIIFNLTGSFKSLQGYMNTIAMFYADKIIYIFESEKAELIRIPKLPIEINDAVVKEHKEKILLMAKGYNYPLSAVRDMPGTIIDEIDDFAFLSVWGELLWNKTKKNILQELVDLPYLTYSDEFKKLFKKATPSDRIVLQETLAEVSRILLENNGNVAKLKTTGGLQYDNYTNKKDENSLPIGHFRINQGNRVSCVAKDNGLLLRKFGAHDFVNNNP